uniref:THAP domain-containing protein 2-like n=1 Tax=Styela clava TaxID=7725 RepID=UPI00193AD308|nr:THAP domain-containing protein 2-like [Styela clava]
MVYCVVYRCSATSEKQPDRSLHEFPKDPKLWKAWIIRVSRENFVPSTSDRVCSYHFSSEDYGTKRTSDRPLKFQRKVLKRGALPCWNLRGDVSKRTRTTSLCAMLPIECSPTDTSTESLALSAPSILQGPSSKEGKSQTIEK